METDTIVKELFAFGVLNIGAAIVLSVMGLLGMLPFGALTLAGIVVVVFLFGVVGLGWSEEVRAADNDERPTFNAGEHLSENSSPKFVTLEDFN